MSLLQIYWWLLVSVLGALLVFLLFVQGGQTMLYGFKNPECRKLIVNSLGRKWEFTYTTLVVFGGAFFAAFPLFYSTSFGGAYWVWMLILASFVVQAVSYEFQRKAGNVLGTTVYRRLLVFNGIAGPFLLGCAVATFFTGSAFVVEKGVMAGDAMMVPAISRWANAWHGLDALFCPWNLVLGIAVLFLSRVLGSLYLINSISDDILLPRLRHQVLADSVPFVICFVAFVANVLCSSGVGEGADGSLAVIPMKYWDNLLSMPLVALLLLVGVVMVLAGIGVTILRAGSRRGIWTAGTGTVFTVLALLLLAGLNGTSFYPSTVDTASSLTITNSSSSQFTLSVMSVVSLIIPFVAAYIIYVWRQMDKQPITTDEMNSTQHKY